MTKKRHRDYWSPEDDATICQHYPTHSAQEVGAMIGRSTKAIWQRAHTLGVNKSRAWIAERARQAMQSKDHPGRATQFAKGLTPWNKGQSYHAGGRSSETQFKPGVRQGRALSLYQPVGSLRIDRDGYLQRKINDDKPFHKRWRAEHLVIWEEANGPLPKGHAVIFKDGDKTHITLDNLELVSRYELMQRNTVHRHGPEIAALSQLRGALKRQINRRTNHQSTGENK